jgi:hypothetical protein
MMEKILSEGGYFDPFFYCDLWIGFFIPMVED